MTGAGRRGLGLMRADGGEIVEAWASLGGRPAVAEQALELDFEISVMAARSPSGEVRCYPAARNHHERQILAWSVLPAGIPDGVRERAQEIAHGDYRSSSLEGLVVRGDVCYQVRRAAGE
jgi:5-(carboxyamino)imidazole ribonucleotide synthase